MEDSNIENQDSTNTDEILDLEEQPEQPTEDVVKLKETNKRLYERAKKAEAEAKAYKARIPQENITPKGDNPKTYGIEDEVLDLRLDGFKKDEVEFIMKNGGRKALEDQTSFVSIALNTKREQRKAEEAASKTNDNVGLTEVERKYTPEQLKSMSAEELEEILPHA